MILKKKQKKNIPIIIFSVFIFIFSFLYLRYFVKMDDGNFLGIVSAPDFTYFGWLKERYNTVSGRLVSEFLMAFLLNHNIIIWKIINALLIIYITYFWCKLSNIISCENRLKSQIFCCCGFFLIIISCLNPSVFWYAGSFSYLWPFAGIVMTVSPLLFYLLGEKVSNIRIILSFFTAVIGTMQEQSALCCTALYIILLILIMLKTKKKNYLFLLPVASILVCDYILFTSPGITGRMKMESAGGFENFYSMNIFEKLLCGTGVYFANVMYISVFSFIIFMVLISFVIAEKNEGNSSLKKHLIIVNILSAFIIVVLNLICCVFERGLAHIIVRKAFLDNKYGLCFYILLIGGFIVLLMSIGLIVRLIMCDLKIGLFVAVLFAAAFCATVVLGFSSSIFASGQRIAFYSNMFMITASVALFASVNNSKNLSKVLWPSVVYSALSFVIDCFAFVFFEIPIMG